MGPDSEDFVKLSQKTLRLNFGSLKKKNTLDYCSPICLEITWLMEELEERLV